MDEKNIQPADLYNMDETGFRIGIAGAQCVISLSQGRPSYLSLAHRTVSSSRT